jgi:hypothetical protein
MGGFLRRNELNAFVSQSAHVNPLEQSLAPAHAERIPDVLIRTSSVSVKRDGKALNSDACHLRGHGYIPMVPKLLARVAVGTENGNASHASRPAPARPTVTVSTWPPAIGDANTGVPAGTGFNT